MSGAGGGGATVPPGGACTSTAQCQGTGFKCNATTKVCDCSVDKPDVCGEGAAAVCSQKMTDPKNCGTCGMACPSGAACDAGACSAAPTEILAKGTGCGAIQLAVQGANIYWTEAMSGKVRTLPVAGGAAPTDLATGQVNAGSIVADATALYWVVPGDGTTVGSAKVMKLALPATAGAQPTVVATATTAKEIFDVAVAAGKVYYTLGNDVHQVTGATDIVVGTAVNYDAPAKVEGDPHGVAVSATIVAWTDVGDRNGVESNELDGTVNTVPDKVGYHELAQSVGSLRNQIEADAMYAYWIDGARFVRNLLAATMPVPDAPIVEAASDIKGFAITATTVYLATKDGSIVKHTIAPGASSVPTPIAIDQTQSDDDHFPGAVVADATKVYWATSDCAIRATGL